MKYWFKKYNESNTSLVKLNKIPDRLLIVHSVAILNAVGINPSTSTHRLLDKLDISQTSVIQTLHAHGRVNKCCYEFPHELTENLALNRVKHVKTAGKSRDDRFIRHQIVTCNESGYISITGISKDSG